MSLALAAALAFSPTATLPSCSWDKPGHDPFMGNVVEAVDRYTNIPLEVRDRLKRRMTSRQYDEIVSIGRDSISGVNRYSPEIRDMHFGQGRVCRSVSRAAWAPTAVERGLVYCEAEHCIIVPTVCRNVSRITRLPGNKPTLAGGPATGTLPRGVGGGVLPGGTDSAITPDKGVLLASNDVPGSGELVFDPPRAGAGAPEGSQAAIQSALASLASANPLGTNGFMPANPADGGGASGGGSGSGAGGGSPASNFNPYPTTFGGGSGGFVPVTPATPAVPTDRLPPTPADPATDPATPTPTVPAAPAAPPVDLPVSTPPVVQLPDPGMTPAVPEPRAWAMWAAGLGALVLLQRRRSARSKR